MSHAQVSTPHSRRLRDNSADAYFHLAVSNFNLGQKQKGIEAIQKAKELFQQGYFMQVSYVETFEQLYLSDIEEMEEKLQ